MLLAALAIADSLVPMVPAEVMAAALMILQPRRVGLIALAFALAAALSAGLLTTLVNGATQALSLLSWLETERLAPGWNQATSLIQAWGAPVLALAAVFPDNPRTSIAVAALAGLAPVTIIGMVLVGKAVLYGLMAWIVWRFPARRRRRSAGARSRAGRLHRALRRFVAFRRWVEWHASKEGMTR